MFDLKTLTDELIQYRKISFNITWWSVSGLKVPNSTMEFLLLSIILSFLLQAENSFYLKTLFYIAKIFLFTFNPKSDKI